MTRRGVVWFFTHNGFPVLFTFNIGTHDERLESIIFSRRPKQKVSERVKALRLERRPSRVDLSSPLQEGLWVHTGKVQHRSPSRVLNPPRSLGCSEETDGSRWEVHIQIRGSSPHETSPKTCPTSRPVWMEIPEKVNSIFTTNWISTGRSG